MRGKAPKKKSANPGIAKTARESLGFESLRPGQKEAVTAILDGHDASDSLDSYYQEIGQRLEDIGATAKAAGEIVVDPSVGTRREVV
jgi:hypothetical protein